MTSLRELGLFRRCAAYCWRDSNLKGLSRRVSMTGVFQKKCGSGSRGPQVDGSSVEALAVRLRRLNFFFFFGAFPFWEGCEWFGVGCSSLS